MEGGIDAETRDKSTQTLGQKSFCPCDVEHPRRLFGHIFILACSSATFFQFVGFRETNLSISIQQQEYTMANIVKTVKLSLSKENQHTSFF